ncbi:hypothetical protein MPER_08613 [Moniliophthora perniciosa FA553]|nr:hypothetical protein MPER_08613 [Moniliophthora perniciosa FA553]
MDGPRNPEYKRWLGSFVDFRRSHASAIVPLMLCTSICWNIFAIAVALIAILVLHYGLRISAPDGPVESQLVWAVSFLPSVKPSLERLSYHHLPPPQVGTADVTAIILNWSRLSNVFGIVAVLCSPALDGAIASIVVWNNNPLRLLKEVRIPSLCLVSEHSNTYDD